MRSVIFVIIFVQTLSGKAQTKPDSTKSAKYYFSAGGFFFYDQTHNYSVSDSAVGRVYFSYIKTSLGINIAKDFYGGFKLQYNYFRSDPGYGAAPSGNHGFMAGPFIGIAKIKPNKVYYYNFSIHVLASNITFSQTPYSDEVVRTDKLTAYLGAEAEVGLKIYPRLFVMVGLALNNPFVKRQEFNFPYAGIVVPFYLHTHYSKTIFNYKRKNPPMY